MEPDQQEQEGGQKKTIQIIIILVLLLLIAGGIIWWFFLRGDGSAGGPRGSVVPFGLFGGDDTRPPTDTGRPNNGIGSDTGERPRLWKISSYPVAGATEYVNPAGVHFIRYIEKERGNVYDVEPWPLRESRVTNETIPRIHDAVFGMNGSSIIFRYVNQVGTIMTNLKQIVLNPAGGDVAGTLSEGEILPNDIDTLSVSPDGEAVFFLTRDNDGVAHGKLLDLPTRSVSEVFTFPFSEWIPQMISKNTIFLTTKASGIYEGYGYKYLTNTHELSKVIDNKKALTTQFSPSGKRALYSENISGSFYTLLYDESNSGIHIPFSPGFTTMPEKCTWSRNSEKAYCGAPSTFPPGLLPDYWYQGRISFSDNIWAYDAVKNESEQLGSPQALAGVDLDITSPFLSKDGSTLFFINKGDSMLWAFTIGAPLTEAEQTDSTMTANDGASISTASTTTSSN
jgi:hypothetical protein